MVNDGSRDATGEILQQAAAAQANYRHLRLPQNRGQAAALYVGLQRARGRFVVTMDGDGQNDPADIPALAGAPRRGRHGGRDPRRTARLVRAARHVEVRQRDSRPPAR